MFVLSYFPLEQARGVVVGECYLESQGCGADGIEADGVRLAFGGAVIVGSGYGAPVAVIVKVLYLPGFGDTATSPWGVVKPVDGGLAYV